MKTTAAPTTERLASIIHIGTRYSVMRPGRDATGRRARGDTTSRRAGRRRGGPAPDTGRPPLYTGLAWFNLCEDALLEEIQEACA